MTHRIEIAGRRIGPGLPPYVIAEMSGNHNGDIERAFRLIDAAAAAGADAVKLQTYTADTMTIAHDGTDFTLETGLWAGRSLHDLYREAQTPWEWHRPLFEHARHRGITIFSSPFDATAVDLLEELDAPAYKIASFELVDLPLICRVAATGKPVIMSTGIATDSEIAEAVGAAREAGCRQIVLLHCTSQYPAPVEAANLRTIPQLAARYDVVSGLSDHTFGLTVPIAAVALGAAVVEKHFTLARADGGPDAAFSLEAPELAALVTACREAQKALGETVRREDGTIVSGREFRRSLYVVRDVSLGEILGEDTIRAIRPGHGLPPKHLPSVLGRRAARVLHRGEPLAWDMLMD